MTSCDYCGNENPEEEHRCKRCGRRFAGRNVFSAPNPYPVSRTSPIRQPMYDPGPAVAVEEAPATAQPARAPVQRRLFTGQVIPIAEPSQRPKRPKRRVTRRPAGRRRISADQQEFDFEADSVQTMVVEPVLYCEHPVAGATHRILAASIDLGLVMAGCAVFFLIFHALGGSVFLGATTLGTLGGAAAVIATLYKLIWCLGSGDSLGMSWTSLRLLNFDGEPPSREQRLLRFAALGLSVGALGLGVLWALGDQEKLAWHDHISKTFPSPKPNSER